MTENTHFITVSLEANIIVWLNVVINNLHAKLSNQRLNSIARHEPSQVHKNSILNYVKNGPCIRDNIDKLVIYGFMSILTTCTQTIRLATDNVTLRKNIFLLLTTNIYQTMETKTIMAATTNILLSIVTRIFFCDNDVDAEYCSDDNNYSHHNDDVHLQIGDVYSCCNEQCDAV